jgi:hypothetical protein
MQLSWIILLTAVLYTPTFTLASSLATDAPAEDAKATVDQLQKRPAPCPKRPVNVQCLRNPCEPNPCGSNHLCCPDYSSGCDYICVRQGGKTK